MGGKDIAEKALEAYNDVFCDIVNVLLFGGEELVKEDELTEATPLSVYKEDAGKLHEQERDIAKFWKDGRIRICLYGLENQTDIDTDMPLRVISYDGAGYRSQLLSDNENKDSDGHKVRYPVVTLVLYFGEERWNKHRKLLDCLVVPEELKPYVSDYKINVFEIAWLEPETVSKFKSDFRIVADYFVRMRRDKTYEPSRETIRHVHEVLQLMAELTKDRRFADIQLPPGMAEGGTNMCEVLDRYWNSGIAKGLAAGREEGLAAGREEGLAAGREEGLIDGIVTSLKNLIANTGMTQAQAMAALGIVESERDKYASLLSS
ncbi:MAG: Rpn family recombination-promoting nuclease/putative transposase [Treponema sp.]|nr:Rpn family recombination-promoting nuclease/putative transposase [Treponema sp.]